MARNDKQLSYEENYKKRMETYSEIYKERTDFASKFKLKSEKTKGYYVIGDPAAQEESGNTGDKSTATKTSGSNNKEKIWNFFADKGFTAAAVAGVMGNLQQESSFSTTAVGPPTKYGRAYGLGQWLGGRLIKLQNEAKTKGVDVSDLGLQLDFLWWELNGGDPTTKSKLDKLYGGLEKVKSSTDYKWVVLAYEDSFERSGGSALSKREAYAKAILEEFGKSNGSAAATTVGNTTSNTTESTTTSAKSLSIQSKQITAKEEVDTSSYVDAEAEYDISGTAFYISTGRIIKGKFCPPSVSRIGYAKQRLIDANNQSWRGWAPLENGFVHMAGVHENMYAPEAQNAFLLLKRKLGWDKIKVIHGFQPKRELGIYNMHNVGMAIDIYVENMYEAIYLADTAWSCGFRAIAIGGDELSATDSGFVHIDCGPKAAWPLNHHDVYKGPGTFQVNR